MALNICIAAYLHGNGGAERQVLLLANNLIKYGHNIYLIILAENKLRYEVSPYIEMVDLSNCEDGHLTILKRYLALRSTYKKIKPDISIHYNFQSAYFSCMMPKCITGKIVYSERGDPSDKEYSGILGLIRKVTIHKIDGFVFQTEGAKNFFDKRVQKKSVIIPNPITVPKGKYEICKNREKRIISVGRLHPQKNQKLLIEAFANISYLLPDYILEIYGEGPLKSYLLNLIKDLGMDRKIFIKAPTCDIFDIIRTSSLFVLSSDYEGMPNTLMEALALGVPSISTDCSPGGAKALIKNGYNGFLVPVGNQSELADKILYLLRNKDIANDFSNHSVDILETHSINLTFDKWNDFLSILSSKTL